MCETEEYAISRFRSLLANALSAPYIMEITPINATNQLKVVATSGKMGYAMRSNPYAPTFNNNAAKITEIGVGASTCASGNQVCNGTAGSLIANPVNTNKNAHQRAGC